MKSRLAHTKGFELNAICPYYTMFPLEYPLQILKKHKSSKPIVLDPFCGRGTTIYAARRSGLEAYGFDTSPIAVAIAQAKLSKASPEDVLQLAELLLKRTPSSVPATPFFQNCFDSQTLVEICSLRESFLEMQDLSDAAAILRAVVLGILHGPLPANVDNPSYLSNQMPRTFASKPDYSVKYWRARGLTAPRVALIDIAKKKLARITDLSTEPFGKPGNVQCNDSRLTNSFANVPKVSVTVTSPPYYGMRTYVQDQWLRMWFLGGPEHVPYEANQQLNHGGHETFIADLAQVWKNVAAVSNADAHLYVRFGSIPSAKSDARDLLLASLRQSNAWRKVYVRTAATADSGKRQADQMGRDSKAAEEFDFHAVLA